MDPTDDDDLDRGARWQGVHDVIRYARANGFDEEPPARIDALLMAAARQHAPARADRDEKSGALERVRRWLVATMMQPAVAGAVAVAVIGGTAGVLYLKGRGGVSEPTVRSESRTAPPAGPMAEPGGPDFSIEMPGGAGTASASSATESDAVKARFREIEEREKASELEGQEAATARGYRPKGGTETGGGGGRGGGGGDGDGSGSAGGGEDGVLDRIAVGEKDPPFDFKPDGRDTTTVVTTNQDRGSGSGSGMTTTIKGRIDSPKPPPPDGNVSIDDEATGKEQELTKNVGSSPETTEVRKPPPSKRTQAENLHRQARTAAKKKDCATVKTMAKRAKQLDATYYKDTFTRDAAVKNCL